jgi:arginase
LIERLGARDAGQADAQIRDTRRDPATGVIGALDVRRAATDIAARVSNVLGAGQFPLVVGGDCTLLLGVFQALPAGCGLWFVDGHADFYDGRTSPTGEAADMDLAILTGHGPPGLLGDGAPSVDPAAVVLLGHRPSELNSDVAFENARIDPAICAFTAPELRDCGPEQAGVEAARRLAGRPAWLHLDLDVLDETALPAVSYPQPLGLDWDELEALTRPLASAPGLIGVSVADFNPERDPGGVHATRVVDLLAALVAGPAGGRA